MTAVILLSICIIGLVMLAMAVGTMFSNRCLRGSCGGPDVLGPDGAALSCGSCPRRQVPQVVSGPVSKTDSSAPPS